MRSCFSMRRWSGLKLCAQNSFCEVLFISTFLFCPCKYSCEKTRITLYTILDKTVEKIVYLDRIFLKIIAVPVRGKGFSSRKGVVLEIVLLRKKVVMMGNTFSSSFVQDCRLYFWNRLSDYFASAGEAYKSLACRNLCTITLLLLCPYTWPAVRILGNIGALEKY